MNNEEKIKAWCEYDSNNMDMYELIVAGEREKMQGVELTPDEIEMIKNCLPYGVTNLKYCIKSNLDLYNKYLMWERILPNLLTKLTTEAT